MANNFSFSTAGSTPNVSPNLSGAFLNMNPSTSQSKALGVAAGSFKPSPTIPAAAPAPVNQPIKKQTVTTAGGDTHTTEYHPPTQSGVLAPAPATFSGTVNKLADTSSQGSPVAGTAAKQLVNTPAGTPAAQGYTAQTAQYGAGNIPIGQQAKDIMDKAGAEYARVGRLGANAEAGYGTTGTSPVAEGNAGVIARNTAEQQAAIEAGAQTALQGTGQELTGQNQAANAANEAAGTALTGQSNQIGAQTAAGNLGNTAQATQQSGLNSAGVLAQPQLGSIGQVPFSPLDQGQGSPLGAPGGTAADAAKVAGQFQGAQAAAAGAGIGAGTGAAAAAAAGGQVEAQNEIAAGTAGTKSWTDIYSKANDSYANYSAQQSAINGISNQVLELMNQKDAQGNPIINPTSSQFANTKLNQLQTQFSSPQYSAFNTAIQSLQARIGQALQAGEIPTAATGNAQKIADGSLSLGALASTLQQVDKEMSTFVSTQKALADYAKSQSASQQTSNSNTPQSNSQFSW